MLVSSMVGNPLAHRYTTGAVARQHLAYPYGPPPQAVAAPTAASQHILAPYIQQQDIYQQGLVHKHVQPSPAPDLSPEQPSPATSSGSSAAEGDHPIGYGAFGVVWSVIDPRDGTRKALKKMPNVFQNLVSCRRVYRELRMLCHFKHENVLSALEILQPAQYESFQEIYVITELFQSDLHKIIVSPQPLSADHVKVFLYQILRGLKYLHSSRIIHRDIKPGNLLVNSNCQLKHQRFVTEAEEREPDVVLIGDSLFSNLNVAEIWQKMFAPLHCLNFSIGADKTQNVLWRCQNGELDNMSPQVIVLCIGTNNYEYTSEETYEGILAIVTTIREKQPNAHLLVVSIPPRGRTHNKLRVKIGEINLMLAKGLKGMDKTHMVTIDPGLFINPYDGTISHIDMYDYVHFTASGYEKFCEPILEEIQLHLKDYMKTGGYISDDAALS